MAIKVTVDVSRFLVSSILISRLRWNGGLKKKMKEILVTLDLALLTLQAELLAYRAMSY